MAFSLSGILSLNIDGFRNSLKTASSSVEKFSDSVGVSGATIGAMVGASVLLAGGLKMAIDSGMQFEKSLSAVRAVSRGTNAEMKLLYDKALELSEKYPRSAKEMADGMQVFASAGFNATETLKGYESAVLLSVAGNLDMAQATEICTSAVRSFKMGVEGLPHMVDVIAMAAADSAISVQDMGISLNYVAPIAAGVGIGLEDLSASIVLLGNHGIKASMAGTTLRGVITNMAKPTKQMRDAMKNMNFKAFDSATGKMKPMSQMLDEMNDGMANMTKEQRLANVAALAGKPALSGMIALLTEGGAKLKAEEEALKNADGAAELMAQTISDNLWGSLNILGNVLTNLGIKAFEDFRVPLTEAVREITALVPKAVNEFKYYGSVLAEHKETILDIVVAWATYQLAIRSAIAMELIHVGYLTAKIAIVEVLTVAIMVYQSTTSLATFFTEAWAGAQLLLNTVLWANPIGIVVLAIGALVISLIWAYNHIDTFKEKVNGAFDSLKEFLGLKKGLGNNDSVGYFATGAMGPSPVKNANGTSYFSGGASMVNERGGEMQIMPSGTAIIPAERTQQLMDGNASSGNNVTIHIDAKGMDVNELVTQLQVRLANI